MRLTVAVSLAIASLLLPLLAFAQGEDALTTAAKQVADRFVQSAQAKRGQVAEIDGPTLYVSLGSGDGILEGQLLQISAKGDPIVVNGETLGYKEKPVATAEVTTVQGERLCLATVKRTVTGQQPAKGNLAYLKPTPPTLAISSFLRQDNALTAMGTEFADKLGMALQATGKFRMVERSRLETALGELKLGLNDLFDPTKAARLGQMIQAKGVVTGTITQQNDRYTINVRVVDIETGTQVLTAVATCGRSDELDRKYGQAGPGEGGGITTPPPGVTKSLFDQDLQWVPQGLHWTTAPATMIGRERWDAPRGMGSFGVGLPGGGAPTKWTLALDGEWTRLTGKIGASEPSAGPGGFVSTPRRYTVVFEGDRGPLRQVTVREGQNPESLSIPLDGLSNLTIKLPEGARVLWSADCQLVK